MKRYHIYNHMFSYPRFQELNNMVFLFKSQLNHSWRFQLFLNLLILQSRNLWSKINQLLLYLCVLFCFNEELLNQSMLDINTSKWFFLKSLIFFFYIPLFQKINHLLLHTPSRCIVSDHYHAKMLLHIHICIDVKKNIKFLFHSMCFIDHFQAYFKL